MSTLNKIFFAFLVIAFSGSSHAALITTSGSSVQFTYDDSLVGLFGSPIVSGDSLTFAPSNFKATSVGLNGGTFSDSTFVVQIDSIFGHVLDSVALTEKGIYSLRGVGAEVLATGALTSVDLTAPNPVLSEQMTSFVVDATGTTSLSTNNPWTASANLDFDPKSTSVSVSIQNLLIALTSNSGEIANINKSYIGLNAVTSVTAVPLPLAVWMFGGGLMGMLSMAKRRKLI